MNCCICNPSIADRNLIVAFFAEADPAHVQHLMISEIVKMLSSQKVPGGLISFCRKHFNAFHELEQGEFV